MWLLSSLDAGTSTGVAALHMLILGFGLGMVMQVLVLATQNAVPYEQLGVATSGATLFRSIGGSLGTALLGAIFTAHLTSAEAAHKSRQVAFTDAIDLVFTVATVILLVAFALSWFIEERPLRQTVESNSGFGESFGAPVDTDSLREVIRGLSRLVGRDRTVQFINDTTKRSGIDISPGVAWLVLRMPPAEEFDEIRERAGVDADSFDAAVAEARELGYYDGYGLGPAGLAVRDQLVAARTDCLRELIADWEPELHPELDPLLERLAEELDKPPQPEAVHPAGSRSS